MSYNTAIEAVRTQLKNPDLTIEQRIVLQDCLAELAADYLASGYRTAN